MSINVELVAKLRLMKSEWDGFSKSAREICPFWMFADKELHECSKEDLAELNNANHSIMTKEKFIARWKGEMFNSNRIAFNDAFIGHMFNDATIERDGIIAELLIIVEAGKVQNPEVRDLTERARYMIGVCTNPKD